MFVPLFVLIVVFSLIFQRLGVGSGDGYIDAREYSGGERHFDVDWSPIIEDLYSPKLGNPLGCRGSACVEVMPTLHGSARLFGGVQRVAYHRRIRVGGRLIRVSDQLDQRSDQRDMDSQIVTVDQFAEAMTSIQEAIASLGRRIDGQQAQQVPPPVGAQPGLPRLPSPCPPTSEDPHARMDRLEQGLRQLRASDRATTWEGFDGVPVASLSAKFRMPDIERCIEEGARGFEAKDGGVCFFFHFSLRGKIAEIIDRPSERDQIQMVLRSLQPRIARHVVRAPFTDFGSLVMALYDVEDGHLERFNGQILPLVC
ncbi:hypothetical protein CK203_088860 [Vitis vinifera]|uniref:Uncharacterized protein n=1 Tax=Vitis vinifera TaxID=29760 RepID=A0A438D4M8_VITVI|nr:hypothetical protein CK203_088860 [Vitis vinifera]